MNANNLLALAREAQRLEYGDHEMAAKQRFRAACTPARIVALCELLRTASRSIPDYSPDFGAVHEFMAADLDAPTCEAEARP